MSIAHARYDDPVQIQKRSANDIAEGPVAIVHSGEVPWNNGTGQDYFEY